MAVLTRKTRELEARRAAARGKLIEAADRLLRSDRAYADLTIEEITSHAGVSRTAFYEHFSDKRGLLAAWASELVRPLLGETARLSRPGPPDPDGLHRFLTSALALAREHASLFRALFEAATYDEVIRAYWDDLLAQFTHLVEERIERYRNQEVRPLNSKAGASVLVGAIAHACYRQVSRATAISDEELVDALTDVWVRAVYGTDLR
jgi:AcrR family transcriptional regulator